MLVKLMTFLPLISYKCFNLETELHQVLWTKMQIGKILSPDFHSSNILLRCVAPLLDKLQKFVNNLYVRRT